MKIALSGHKVVQGMRLPDDAVRWVERDGFYLSEEEKVAGVSVIDAERCGLNFNKWMVRRVIIAINPA